MPLPTAPSARSAISQHDLAPTSSLDRVIGDAIPAREYALARLTVAAESPSVNPHGTLVELTKALVNGDLRDDEVVVVADVYENGSAHIAEVVEPSTRPQCGERTCQGIGRRFDLYTVRARCIRSAFRYGSRRIQNPKRRCRYP